MQISSYENIPVNEFVVMKNGTWVNKYPKGSTRFWKTDSVSTALPGWDTRGGIGRVDHFKKKSIDQIVKACIKQVILKEGMKGRHTINIHMYERWDYENDKMIENPQRKHITITVDV